LPAPSGLPRPPRASWTEEKTMVRKSNPFITAALCVFALGRAWAQSPKFATLDIEWENYVGYTNDLADPSRFGMLPNMVNPNIRNFMTSVLVADIVSVNGRPAKGSWVARGEIIMLVPSPTPGQAIGDIGRGGVGDYHIEILQTDGTPVGSIMSSGLITGPAPPGAPSGLFLNVAVTGGTGAFLGARGILTSPPFTIRLASMAEDPANRRTLGGGRGHFLAYLIPLTRPEIMTTASGPAAFHAGLSPVT